jgi:hypothetical protein
VVTEHLNTAFFVLLASFQWLEKEVRLVVIWKRDLWLFFSTCIKESKLCQVQFLGGGIYVESLTFINSVKLGKENKCRGRSSKGEGAESM